MAATEGIHGAAGGENRHSIGSDVRDAAIRSDVLRGERGESTLEPSSCGESDSGEGDFIFYARGLSIECRILNSCGQ